MNSPNGESTATDADYEAALAQLAGLLGEHVLILHHAAGAVVGGSSGELVDALPLRPGTAEESIVFRLVPASTFVLDRAAFRGWRLHLGDGRVEAVDVELEGGAAVTITLLEAVGW